jgi:hypothetical protein
MTGKRSAIVCLALAALLAVGAVSSLLRHDGPRLGDDSALGVSHAVGAFLPSLIALILGLWLLKKPAPKDPAGR